MKKIYIIAIVSAAICGILLYSFFSGYEKKTTMTTEENQQKAEQIVVAAEDIAAYTELTEKMLKVVAVSEGSAHTNAAHTIDEVIGKITEREIVSGEQILTNKVYKTGDSGTSLSYEIPKGMRAMTKNVDIEKNLAGYMEEGDLIDIIGVDSSGKDKKEVMLSAVKILRLGEVTNRGEGKVNSNITLLLSPSQCIKLANIEVTHVALREKTDISD